MKRPAKNTRIALVTGANRGIGHAIVEDFLRKGFFVIANVRTATHVSSSLQKRWGKKSSLVLSADIAREVEIAAMVRTIQETFGRLDVLVNNAGIIYNKDLEPLATLSMERLGEYLDINVKGGLFLTQQCMPLLKRSTCGKVVFINTALSYIASPVRAGYIVSKTANIGAVRALALELAPFDICVNGVVPGYIRTRVTNFKGRRLAEKLERIPLRRMGKPEEVAALVSFLSSPESDYITGQQLHVNGGLYLS